MRSCPERDGREAERLDRDDGAEVDLVVHDHLQGPPGCDINETPSSHHRRRSSETDALRYIEHRPLAAQGRVVRAISEGTSHRQQPHDVTIPAQESHECLYRLTFSPGGTHRGRRRRQRLWRPDGVEHLDVSEQHDPDAPGFTGHRHAVPCHPAPVNGHCNPVAVSITAR